MSEKLKWGIITTGAIAKVFARGLACSSTGELVAVASRDQAKADAFGKEWGISKCYGSYDALLADPDVQAVYIATPHPMHAEWAIKAADAGKHILCEKPLTLNYPEAMAVIEAARRNDVFLMEAFMYRCHPQTAKLVELIRDKVIGDVRIIEATFSFDGGWNPEGRLLKNSLGGGGILDVGCYCTSMARLLAGAALGQDFADPAEVKGIGRLGETGVDEYAVAVLRFPGDVIAHVSTGVRLVQDNVVRVYGTEGSILVPSPWFCSRDTNVSKIIVQCRGKNPYEVEIPNPVDLYANEADTVAANISRRQAPSPAMSWNDTLGNMKTLDLWRLSIGLTYDAEKLDAEIPPADRKPLRVRPNNMKYGEISGVGKKVSRLGMGAVLEGMTFMKPHAFFMFDEFFMSGGNLFDTAYIYAGGLSERLLGEWARSRGVREQIVILAKGAHTPHCNPVDMTSQLLESLERLGTEYIDIYMLHRDNEEIPVAEFIDALSEHLNAGRIRTIGASNWSIQRIEAANEYVHSKGLQGFSVVSNNLCLARMVKPVWDGCIASSDPESRAWFEKTSLPIISWSSTGRGFFVRGNPEDLSDQCLVQSWYSEDNFERLSRARHLATQKSALPVQIALAWVLHQPFPSFALIGPQTMNEMHISLSALDISLSTEECRWLYEG
ncbi:MAG: aldo/keto reductase [Armatimonadetes bacterium]|nr:aldo/keto reductase [Armatimonadota bacterium]